MIDHISFGVSDFSRSTLFYDQALAPLGVHRLFDVPEEQSSGVKVTGYGETHPWFWIAEENAISGLLHIAFQARSHVQVEAFHTAAVHAGGADNGKPGFRVHYHPDYFAAFVLDPDGHNIEAVCHSGLER